MSGYLWMWDKGDKMCTVLFIKALYITERCEVAVVITFQCVFHKCFLCRIYMSNTLILSFSASVPLNPGSLSHSECSSPSLITPPQSPLNLETSSFVSSQSQGSISTLPRISVSPVPIGERRKDRYECSLIKHFKMQTEEIYYPWLAQ